MAFARSVAGIGCGMHVEVICTSGALWPNPLVHRRHSTKRCAARRKPDTSARPWRARQSTPTQSWRAMPSNVPSHVVPYTPRLYPVMTHRMQTHASSLPAYARSLVVVVVAALLSVGVGEVRSGQARQGTWQYARLHSLLSAVGGTARRPTLVVGPASTGLAKVTNY